MKQAGKTVDLLVADLKPFPGNYRRHPSRQVEQLAASLKRHGQYRGIVVQQGTNYIIAGHGVVEAARSLGVKTITAQVIDVGIDEARQLLVDDNELSRLAEDDPALLAALLEGLRDTDFPALAYDDGEIGAMLAALAEPRLDLVEQGTLAERFGVPPFSVLDARQGYWQERKRSWLALGMQSELGRGGGAVSYQDPQLQERQAQYRAVAAGPQVRSGQTGTSPAGTSTWVSASE